VWTDMVGVFGDGTWVVTQDLAGSFPGVIDMLCRYLL